MKGVDLMDVYIMKAVWNTDSNETNERFMCAFKTKEEAECAAKSLIDRIHKYCELTDEAREVACEGLFCTRDVRKISDYSLVWDTIDVFYTFEVQIMKRSLNDWENRRAWLTFALMETLGLK